MYNAGKYFSKLFSTFVGIYWGKKVGDEYFYYFVAANGFATIYSMVWDYYMDWGLFRSWESKTYMLRPKIMYPAKFYYFAMVTNFLLRFTWVISVVKIPVDKNGVYSEFEF